MFLLTGFIVSKDSLLNTMLGTYFGSGGSCGFVKSIIKKERYSSLRIVKGIFEAYGDG